MFSALESPDYVSPGQGGKMHAWKQRDRFWLRVTYIDEDQARVVITITIKDSGPSGMGDHNEDYL